MDARWENITNSQDRLAGDVLVEQKPSRRASESPFALRSEDKPARMCKSSSSAKSSTISVGVMPAARYSSTS